MAASDNDRLGVSNRVLLALPKAELLRMHSRLEVVQLNLKGVLTRQDEPVEHLVFVEKGTVSMIMTMHDGSRIEVGLVGPEGIVGLSLFLGAPTAAVEAMVQVSGSAYRIGAAAFREALVDAPSLNGLLLRYVDAFYAQIAQTAACNGRHQIEQRLARWMLMTHDRVEGDDFTMTQEFMATMLGVQRPSVTIALGALQRAGLLQHGRSRLVVLDRPGLEAAACECYSLVQRRFAWLMKNGINPAVR